MNDKRENLLPSSSPSQLLSIDEELWWMAEERAQEILWTIEPNVLSEENRKDVIDYVQRLIRDYYGAEVFPFGSVPLKTYLPDGDIDLTALSHEDAEEDLAQAVCNILQSGDDPEYQVKDIQYIRAQVQLVKCTVKNIAVDISFNQMAGLYTLRFLEQVDQLVGKNHIFKRSIILIKAWCYYESRLLGGHHGLLSTYAIEILVLYIINRFHSSVRGPLEVLYIFLDYYGSFDWDHNYVSIWGPKTLSSLPEIVEAPECDRGEFLLQKDFLRNYRDMCSFSARTSETMTHEFPVKFMNILDPLRNDNNLGRSVNIASLHRLRFALSYGARRLKQILTLPGENMGAALEKFFFSTLDRNGKGERADVDIPVSPFGTGRSEESVLRGDCDSYYGGLQYVQLYRNYAMPVTVRASSPSSPSHDDILALSTQQNWNMFYQSGTDVYIPGQTLYHPTYSLEEGGKSRGTGTYIPDLNYNSYWDMRAKAIRPRRLPSAKHNVLPKSPPKKQVEEVHSATDMIRNSRTFELSNEDFPILPCIHKAIPPTQAQESALLAKVHSETDMDDNSPSFELSKEEFSLLAKVHTETDMDGNSKSFYFSNEDFPLLPNVRPETNMDGNSRSFELSFEDFPLLPSTCKTVPSESVQLTKQAKSSTSSKLKHIEFGTYNYKKSQSLTQPSLSKKNEKEDSGVSLSQDNGLVVSKVAVERKEESPKGNEKMD
ncbi:nucleotidyltransferase protein [Spatholobus suberectus]|nr:nucleotidyltransferase protein [Spatholobus suberectus]